MGEIMEAVRRSAVDIKRSFCLNVAFESKLMMVFVRMLFLVDSYV